VAATKTILFFYGTLKRGELNNGLVAGQEYLGEAWTAPRYRVYDLGPYPGLVLDDSSGLAVAGELWAVDATCLAELDRFEGVPGLFIRAGVSIEGRADAVEAYLWNRPVPEGVAGGDRWPLLPRGGS
jgi:gamma-glutamylcyclotransferase (GGCT)/AIG2-like uncharacterized protein YtfP